MATWEDVRRIALSLPGVTEREGRGQAQWRVGDRLFVWERPLRKSDVPALGPAALGPAALGPAAPVGEIVAARVADQCVRQALMAEDPTVYFTIPHFDNSLVVLARLDRIRLPELEELTVDAWLGRAPVKLSREYLAERDSPE